MRTIAIINQKGGCGKTTTAINLAGVLARQGRRTLLVDLDPQSHCAAGLAIPEQRIDVQIGDAMLARPEQSIDWTRLLWRVSRHLDLAPSTVRLAALESARGGLAGAEQAELRLAGVLRRLADQYDFCLIDCPPNIGLLTYNALAACTEVIVPVETAFFSLQGASKQLTTVRTVAKRLGVTPLVRVLPTMHEAGSTLATDVLDELTRRFGDALVPVVIRSDARLKEAVSFGQPIVDYAGDSTGAQDYSSLAAWLLSDAARVSGAEKSPERTLDAVARVGPPPLPSNPGRPRTTVVAVPPVELSPERSSAFVTALLGESPVLDGAMTAEVKAHTHVVTRPAPLGPAPVARAADMARAAGASVLPAMMPPPPPPPLAPLAATTTVAPPLPVGAMTEAKGAALGAQDIRARLLELTDRVSKLAQTAAPVPGPITVIPREAPVMPSPELRALLGVRVTASGVLFVQPAIGARTVQIAGDFNDWTPTATPMVRNEQLGVFERLLPLPAGRWKYRLVVDGRWTHDTSNPVSEPNPFGELNSVVEVSAPRGL